MLKAGSALPSVPFRAARGEGMRVLAPLSGQRATARHSTWFPPRFTFDGRHPNTFTRPSVPPQTAQHVQKLVPLPKDKGSV